MVEYKELMQPIEKELEDVSNEIKKQLTSEVALVNQVANYIIDSGGKRLRPALVLLMSKVICSGQNTQTGYYLDLNKLELQLKFEIDLAFHTNVHCRLSCWLLLFSIVLDCWSLVQSNLLDFANQIYCKC